MTSSPPFQLSLAVVIGIDHYRSGIPELRTAVNDARRMGELLAAEHGYEVIAILDADATQARIAKLLTDELPSRIGENDRVMFYFAGHGVARDGDDGPNGYLLPVDARRGDETSFLHMPLVHDALLALTCRHMLVVLDSCFSGAFRWSGTRAFEDDYDVVHQEKYDRFVKDAAWQVLTSASQDQKAIDQLSTGALGSRPGTGAHSPFALALFDAISGKGDIIPSGKGDGLVTATELYLYVEDTLQNAAIAAGKQQTPRLWPLAKHDKGEFLFFVPGRELTLPPAPPLTFENNPWRGLASYEAADAGLFFGRDAEIAALTERVQAQPLTVVLGASGSGKSSLVKAGVVPRLAAAGWQVAPIMRPGTSPLTALARALAPAGHASNDATPDTIAAFVQARLSAHPRTRLLLVIDQFEEMITLVRRNGERERVMALLVRLLAAHPDALRVIITIRTDYEPNFDRAALAALWQQGRFVVQPLSREKLRSVIEKPATARVLYFEPSNLVDVLLDEVTATPGALPLLSFALSEMYIRYVERQSRDRAITRADFDAVGGVVGALRARAESEHDALDETSRGTLRRVMLRLVTAEGTGVARRRATEAELDFADDGERERAGTIVQQLIDARLLVKGKEPDGEAFVEPAHDALVRGWGRLAEWVREENDARFPLAQQQRLARAAELWDRSEGDAKHGQIWRDAARSAQLTSVVRKQALWLNRRELAFASRSIRGRRVTLAIASSAVVTIVIAAVIALIGARLASQRAEQVRIASIVRSATAMVGEDPLLAALMLGSLDSGMVRSADDATRLAMLGAALELRRLPRVVATFESGGNIFDAAVSADGQLVATAAADSVVRIWRLATPGTPTLLPRAPHGVGVVLFSPDASHLAVGDGSGTVRLWASSGGGTPVVLTGEAAAVQHIEFSDDGQRVLVSYDAHPARVFNSNGSGAPRIIGRAADTVELAHWADGDRSVVVVTAARDMEFWSSTRGDSPTHTVRAAADRFVALEPSLDGRQIAIGTANGKIHVYDAATARLRRVIAAHADAIRSLSWSADGQTLVSASNDETIRITDSRTGAARSTLRRSGDNIQAAVVRADGRRIVLTSGTTFRAMIWNGEESGTPLPLSGQTNELVQYAFVAGGDRVLTASEDGSVRLWELPAEPFYHGATRGDTLDNVRSVSFSRDGTRAALATRRGAIAVSELAAPAAREILDSTFADPCAVSFAPDDQNLDAVSCSGHAASWTLAHAVQAARRIEPYAGFALADFAPHARRALWSSESGEVRAFDAGQPARSRVVRPANVRDRRCAALSDDGQRIAVCAADGSIEISAFVPAGAPTLIRHAGTPTALTFSHDGAHVAVGYDNGSTRIMPSSGADTGRLLTGQREPVSRIDFAPGDRQVLAISDDGTVQTWDLVRGISTVTLRPRGPEVKSARFVPDGRRILTLGYSQGEARLWNVDGSGGSVALPGNGAIVTQAMPSPDGRWVVVTTNDQAAYLFPVDLELALQALRVENVCLTAVDRRRYLSEENGAAQQRFASCQQGSGGHGQQR